MNKLYFLIFITAATTFSGCKKDQPVAVAATTQIQVITGMSSIETTIAAGFDTRTGLLLDTVNLFQQTPTAALLSSSQRAWKQARNPWESNESFAFGPVENLNIDPNADTWPFDMNSFTAILASSDVLTAAYVAAMVQNTRGFHAIEYLLFGLNGQKAATDFTVRELLMLTVLTQDLKLQSGLLKTNWTAATSGNFEAQFLTAGSTSTTYKTTADAILDVIASMADITDELASSKIQQSLTGGNIYAESRFSDYTLTDYQNNIAGVAAAYTGVYGTLTVAGSLSSYVATLNPALNLQIIAQINACVSLAQTIPGTYSQALVTSGPELVSLQTALNVLNKTLTRQLTPIIK